jgi:hypothetical protein
MFTVVTKRQRNVARMGFDLITACTGPKHANLWVIF